MKAALLREEQIQSDAQCVEIKGAGPRLHWVCASAPSLAQVSDFLLRQVSYPVAEVANWPRAGLDGADQAAPGL